MTFLTDKAWRGRVYSGGWVTPDGGDAAVIEPATGAELGRTGIAAPADMARAARLAQAAQPAWAATPHTERAAGWANWPPATSSGCTWSWAATRR